jgi:nitric-oxide synthase
MMRAAAFRAPCVASAAARREDAAPRRAPRAARDTVPRPAADASSAAFPAAARRARLICLASRDDTASAPRRWSRGAGGSEADAEVLEVTRKRGDCYGCGVALQTDFPSVSGYVPKDEYATKAHHRQLDGMMLCARCSDLSHGRMVNAVAGQGGARLQTGLITPAQLREQLCSIREKKALVVKVVDATDFHGSFLNRVRDVVGGNPILLVLTKVDLLPKDTDLDALEDWVYHEVVTIRRLTLAGVACVSSRKNVGVKKAVGAMFAERKGRDVYVLGAANVGKSTFIRAALKAMREEGNFGVPAKRLPTASAMPGTTLGVIPLRAFEGKGVLYDTPGVFLHHRLNSILSGTDIKRFGLGASLKRFEPRPRVGDETEDRACGFEGLSLLWGPLLRVDVVDASRDARLVFFGPKGMRVTVVETASLPDARALEMKADAERERRRAARTALEEDAEGGGGAESSSNAAPLAAAAAAAGRAASAAMEDEMLRVPSSSVGVVSGDGFEDPEGGDDVAFIQRLVREVEVATEASDEDAGLALRDLSVSGMNGWLRVTRSSRRGACSMRVRVLGPRGLEVFDREPMPVT